MFQKFEAQPEQAARVGLMVNATKIKEIRFRSAANAGNISWAGEILERLTAFTYLCNLITTAGGTKEDVEAMCRKAQAAITILVTIWICLMDSRPGD